MSSRQVPMDEPVEAEVATVVLKVVEELTEQELAERQSLELKVERTFVEAGKALRTLRDRRLYRNTHKTFEEYCRDRFGFTRISANYKIAAAEVFENLVADDEQLLITIGYQILPTNERQVRPLANLEPDEQRQVWHEAVKAVDGKTPSGRIIKGIVERLKEKPLPQLSITYKRGDMFTLQGLTGAERRYDGCWAIAHEVHEFSLKVETHDAMLLVKPHNLNPIDDRAVRRQLTTLFRRIQRLRKRELDRGAEVVLESLGKRMYLTEVEQGILSWLENFYRVG